MSHLRARLDALANEWEQEAALDELWLNGGRVEVGEARELPAVIRTTRAHAAELRAALSAEPSS